MTIPKDPAPQEVIDEYEASIDAYVESWAADVMTHVQELEASGAEQDIEKFYLITETETDDD